MERNFALMADAAARGETLPMDKRVKMRYDAALVAPSCAEAVNKLFIHSGVQGIYRDHPINRAWRDVNCGRTHVANYLGKFARNRGSCMFAMEGDDFFL